MAPCVSLLRTALWAATASLSVAAPTDGLLAGRNRGDAVDVVSEQIFVPDPLPTNFTAFDVTRRSSNFYLRVMPLGASITEGVASSDGNGYRKWIRDALRYNGWQVNMVGSKQNGNMRDKVNSFRSRQCHC